MQLPLMSPDIRASNPHLQGFHFPVPTAELPSQLAWIPKSGGEMGRGDAQCHSLSLSCSLRSLDAEKLGKISLGNGELYYQNQGVESSHKQKPFYSSRYLKAAQELLEEFCCVGRGQIRNPNNSSILDCGGSSSSKNPPPPISNVERSEYQSRKIKLLSMLEEVCIPFLLLI